MKRRRARSCRVRSLSRAASWFASREERCGCLESGLRQQELGQRAVADLTYDPDVAAGSDDEILRYPEIAEDAVRMRAREVLAAGMDRDHDDVLAPGRVRDARFDAEGPRPENHFAAFRHGVARDDRKAQDRGRELTGIGQ